MTDAPSVPPEARTAAILLVDDREQNLVALEAILAPLGQELVRAASGEDALRELLRRDFAVILLDVQMPGLDGFETARLIKQRERTRHTPILFLTAISRDSEQVFKGYSAGAVDYILKPFDPDVLRSKVAVFVELWQRGERLRSQELELRRREVAEAVFESEERYRTLAEAMPQIVWINDAEGRATYYNRRWFEYTGIAAEAATPDDWQHVVHPDELPETVARFEEAARTGGVFEMEYRLRRADGRYRWHLGRSVPLRDASGATTGHVGTATDIDDQRAAQDAQRFLVEAGAILGASLDYRATLADVARAAVPGVADWATVHIVEGDGSIRQLGIAHADPAKLLLAEELQVRYPPASGEESAVGRVIRTHKPELVPEIADETIVTAARDTLHLDLLRELGIRSYLVVPLVAGGRAFGAISFVLAESGRRYGPSDLALAEELARRAATAIENARLYAEAERRAQAARALANVGDGVVLLDRDGLVRLWNPAAAEITGIAEGDALDRPLADVLPGWQEVSALIPVVSTPGQTVSALTLPLELDGREVWISGSGVGFDEGVVYAFRDLTEERRVEAMKSDFVATVSHELRTPLAAIHGSALTILRPDLELDDELQARLLRVIGEESQRLAQIVNDLLLASHLDSGRLQVQIERCNPVALAEHVVETARVHLPENVEVELDATGGLPEVAADPAQLRQVLENLVENAVKYSPDGGEVRVALEREDGAVRFTVSDEGLGIPAAEHRRVFEKFYRLDPNMTRGIGGTGLGLYICRELVRMMDGRIWVESRPGVGSTFAVEIPVAGRRREPAHRGPRTARAR
ncbi:MAG TPA: ATP-binding protein [Gaiellaceae bacterium]|nr:ATP-binding protein [Gaiellaceae bacterium]